MFIRLKITNMKNEEKETIVNVNFIVSVGQHKDDNKCYVNTPTHSYVVLEPYHVISSVLMGHFVVEPEETLGQHVDVRV